YSIVLHLFPCLRVFFSNDASPADPYTLSLHDALPIFAVGNLERAGHLLGHTYVISGHVIHGQKLGRSIGYPTLNVRVPAQCALRDRKSTRLNSSHVKISYAVFCLKKKIAEHTIIRTLV